MSATTCGQRHGDLVWRVRFHDERWLYLVLHLEFQSTVDRAMAVRMLAYTTLLYQKLIGEGVLREHDALPPVLPIVIYNGRWRWNAAADASDLIASGGAALARYQPAQRYFLLDEGRIGDADLPGGNLVSALIAQGRAEERALLCRQAERKFDAATARRLAAALEDVADAGRLAEVGDWIIECGTAADLLARVSDERRRGV